MSDTANLARLEALARRVAELEALIARINRGLVTLPARAA